MLQSEQSFPLCAFSITSLLLLICVTCHAGKFSSYSQSLSPAAFASGIVTGGKRLMHRRDFLTQCIEPIFSNVIFMISGLSRPAARSRGLVGFDDTCVSCPSKIVFCAGNFARHGGFQWHFVFLRAFFTVSLNSMSSGSM